MEREKLKLTKQEGKDIVNGDSRDYTIIEDNIIDHGRWTVTHEIVIMRNSDKKYFSDTYRKGSTEMQDERPYEYDNPSFEEVFPVEKTIIVYQ